MRGAERPAKVQWTRPFLPPLQPLTQEAARLTFIDIADDIYDLNSIDQVLSLTGNMPLAIDLISHLVAEDGCANVLCRWNEDKTSLISEGYDRRSNLDLSIALSLSSPRMASIPQAQDLLSSINSSGWTLRCGTPTGQNSYCQHLQLQSSLASDLIGLQR
jgi:hypothetical protein